jgi:hypothetical protein
MVYSAFDEQILMEFDIGLNLKRLPFHQLTPWSRVHLEKLIVRSASQEILRLFWNPKVHYRVYKSPPPVPIVSQMNLIHTPKSYFPKIHFNIILPFTPRSSEWSLPFRLSNQNFVHISYLPHAPHASAIPSYVILRT